MNDAENARINLSSPDPRFVLSLEGGVGTCVIANEERRNAFDLAMWQAFPDVLDAFHSQSDCRVICLRGSGGTFVSGADISEFKTTRKDAQSARSYEIANVKAFETLRHSSLPTVAAIEGFCLGGGFGIAAAAHIRIAKAGAQFGVPAAKLGLAYPPQALSDITALIGPGRTALMLSTGRRFDAATMASFGFVDMLVSGDEFETETSKILNDIVHNAPMSIHAGLQTIRHVIHANPTAQDVQSLAEACFDSADYAEGRQAFLAKRKPVFKGA